MAMERKIGAYEARRRFGKLLRDVEMQRDAVVVERNGEAVAAVVPIELYRQWQRSRQAFFDTMENAARSSGITSEDEAMKLALEAQAWTRSKH